MLTAILLRTILRLIDKYYANIQVSQNFPYKPIQFLQLIYKSNLISNCITYLKEDSLASEKMPKMGSIFGVLI